MHIGAVGLVVRDLAHVAEFYRTLLLLETLDDRNSRQVLGTCGLPLLELVGRPDALPDDPRTAGLYHTAFLMPTRADLARWILHISRSEIAVTGASDHAVSEAIYLDDPEGNGVEIYADRSSDGWQRDGKIIFQKTDPLDIGAILAEVGSDASNYRAAPAGLRIGHMHLRVGEIEAAEAFYADLLEMEITRRRMGATFLASEKYHHHVAANTWQSLGAGQRDPRRSGLAWFELVVKTPAQLEHLKEKIGNAGLATEAATGGFEFADPWGVRLRVILSDMRQPAECAV